jgi:hypothetical protein
VLVVDGDAWLTQAEIGALFGVTVSNVNQHIAAIFGDGECSQDATIKNCLTVRTEGNRRISREVAHYSSNLVLAVGYRVRSSRGVEFRQWVTDLINGKGPESTTRAMESVIARQLASVVRAELAPVVADVQRALTEIGGINAELATLRQSAVASVESLAALEAKSTAQHNALTGLQADVAKVSAGTITSKEHKRIQAAIKEFVACEKELHPGASEASLRKRFYRELEEVTRWSKAWSLLPTVLMPTAQQVIDNIRKRQQARRRDIAVSNQGELFTPRKSAGGAQ